MRNLIAIICLTLIVSSCDNGYDGMKYKRADALNFVVSLSEVSNNNTRSTNIFFDRGNVSEIEIEVQIMGRAATYDRHISLTQLNAGDAGAAVPGVDYKSLSDPEYDEYLYIPAGSTSAKFPVYLYKTVELYETVKDLKLGITGNEYFNQGATEYSYLTINFTAKVEMPGHWNRYYSQYFGLSWGPRKMEFLVLKSGITDDWYDTKGIEDTALLTYLSAYVKEELKKENAKDPDNPLTELNGNPVTFDE